MRQMERWGVRRKAETAAAAAETVGRGPVAGNGRERVAGREIGFR